jgi:hypothetical protein
MKYVPTAETHKIKLCVFGQGGVQKFEIFRCALTCVELVLVVLFATLHHIPIFRTSENVQNCSKMAVWQSESTPIKVFDFCTKGYTVLIEFICKKA